VITELIWLVLLLGNAAIVVGGLCLLALAYLEGRHR
jgi:hypothetical protein